MKRVILPVFLVLVILGLGYFGMWFFLSQPSAMKVAWISNTVSPKIMAGDSSGFQTAFDTAQHRVAKDLLKLSGNKFLTRLNDVCSRYGERIHSGDSSKPETKAVQFAFLAEIVNSGLERAEYSEPSVPLGALKSVLLNYTAMVKQNEPALKASPAELSEIIFTSDRNYLFLLYGKVKVLTDMLNTNDPTNMIIALKEIENSKVKKVSQTVFSVFEKATQPDLKLQAARTLFSLQFFKNSAVNTYLIGLLENEKLAPDIIPLLSSSDDPVYLKNIIPFTNSKDSVVKDAAIDAVSRLKTR